MGIVPPFGAEQPFQDSAHDILHHGAEDHAEYEQTCIGVLYAAQGHGSRRHPHAVDRAERHVQEPPVLELPRLDPHIDALHQPAGESPENEYQKQLIKTIFKRHFCSAPPLHRMLFIPFILSYSAGTCHFIFYKRNICIICQSVL